MKDEQPMTRQPSNSSDSQPGSPDPASDAGLPGATASDATQTPPVGSAGDPEQAPGILGPDHWSKARSGMHNEALEYYRERSKAPGVAEGGGARNFYCMDCDGVISMDHEGEQCPHCGAALAGKAKRYFNWVEIDQPPSSDLKALLPYLLAIALAFAGILWLILR